MERLSVSTDVFVPPDAVYEFLVDFPAYARYSEHLQSVERRGDGAEGTVYEITVAWWRLTRTVRSTVTDVDPPERIDWRLEGPVGASGAWLIEPHDAPDDADLAPAPGDAEAATRVTLRIGYDPGTIDAGRLDLPAFLSLDALVDRLAPLVAGEAERTVERIVADLEGEPRPVTLRIDSSEEQSGDERE